MSYKYINTSLGDLQDGQAKIFDVHDWPRPSEDTQLIRINLSDGYIIDRYGWSYGGRNTVQKYDPDGALLSTIYQNTSAWAGYYAVALFGNSLRFYGSNQPIDNITEDTPEYARYTLHEDDIETGRDWDETPSYDPTNDPHNELSVGGALADLMQISSAIMDPERFLDVPSAEDDLGAQAACTPMLMTKSMFAAFGTALWSSSVWQSLINIFSGSRDPLNAIISCNDLPIDPVFIPKGADKATKLASVDITGSRFYPVTQRYIAFPMATFNIKEVWGNDKDYTGTNIQIWLPYIGMKTLDPIDVIGATLTVEYKVDLYTGDLVAAIFSAKTVKENTVNFSGLIASFSGNCARPLPLARINNDGFMKSLVGTAALAAVNPTAGMVGAAVGLATASRPLELFNTSVAGAEGALLYQRCYLIVHRDMPVYAEHWREMQGVPQSGYRWLRTLSGYTEVADVDLEPLTGATEAEKAEILTYLTNGVYIN